MAETVNMVNNDYRIEVMSNMFLGNLEVISPYLYQDLKHNFLEIQPCDEIYPRDKHLELIEEVADRFFPSNACCVKNKDYDEIEKELVNVLEYLKTVDPKDFNV